ncbi:hypothetical protein O3G_MSEX002671 [Manduca sexta]|uniref:Uncharacterized protein n=1 Tax=Manduca sexta TaxID=7130 RepID=A0A921YQ46_MANSE|nr:hypothetical protein O3G_MSEX002671 [Manduca sexta]KAG6443094.1 hypothetical protein O3G_MSEX002671 [Manduca sexta]KAG6443095.1 hypothetical protein O3G_MSEX002671 [Manduca sexta]
MSRHNLKENETFTEKGSMASPEDQGQKTPNKDENVHDLTVSSEQHSMQKFDPTEAEESTTIQPTRLPSPQFPEYSSKSSRLLSFSGWPSHKRQKPEDLADAGLFYTGDDDKTICFYCGGGIKDWEETDDPWEEHVRFFSDCDFVRNKIEN